MQHYLGIFLTLLISLACKDMIDCSKIKNGEFYYYTKGTRDKVNIHRTDSIQIETDGKTDSLLSKSKVVWNDVCKFDMYLNAFSDTKLIGDDSIIAATPAHVAIIEINDSFYVCLVKLSLFDKNINLKDTMFFKNVTNKQTALNRKFIEKPALE